MPPNTTRRAALGLVLSSAVLAPAGLGAQIAEDPLERYLWTARPVIVFAPAAADPRFVRQMRELESRADEFAERDVVVLTDIDTGASRAEASALRTRFRPQDFTLLLIGKDGQVKLRRPGPVSGSQLLRQIDRMPLRQQETGRR